MSRRTLLALSSVWLLACGSSGSAPGPDVGPSGTGGVLGTPDAGIGAGGARMEVDSGNSGDTGDTGDTGSTGGDMGAGLGSGTGGSVDGPVSADTVNVAMDGGGSTHQQTGESWTILVYMAADNNLEAAALLDLKEMAAVGSSDQVRIVVQIDRSAGYASGPAVNLPDFSGGKRLLVHKGSLEVLQSLGDIDSGNQATLAQFIAWGVSQYPADRTALVLWDHGGGWNGYGVDETSGSLIRPSALSKAIGQGLASGGLARLSLVAFDACLMATFEIASMLSPYAEYLLASEETVPGHGFDYAQLAAAVANPTISATALSQQIITGYVDQATVNASLPTITISLTDLYALDDLDTALGKLGAVGGAPLPVNTATSIGRARAAARGFGDQGTTPGVMVDLVDLAARVAAEDPSYAAVADAIAVAVSKAVVSRFHGPSRAGSNGMSAYFPFHSRDEDPTYKEIAEVAPWRQFLDSYLTAADGGQVAAPSFASPDGLADAQVVNGDLVVSGALTPGSSAVINQATLYYGVGDASSGTFYVLGSNPASFSTTIVQGSWNLSILRLDQGSSTSYGYLDAEVAADGSVSLTIPFVYRQTPASTAQTAIRLLVFDSGINLVQDSYYLDSGGVFGQLDPPRGSTLNSTILVIDSNGQARWSELATAFDATALIVPSIETLPSGSLVFGELNVENIKGDASAVIGVAMTP
jgi:hypothetical protein